MDEFGRRLDKLMASVGLKSEQVAYLLGVSVDRVNNYLTGYIEPDDRVIGRLAQIFNVSEAYMANLTEDPKCAEDPFAKEVFVASRLRRSDGVITKRDIVGTVYMNRDEMHGKEYYALIAKDDAMAKARIFEGDVLIVRRQTTANNGDIVVAMTDEGETLVRRYSRSGNVVTLTAEGDAIKYQPLKIDTKNTALSILGKVCEIRVKP